MSHLEKEASSKVAMWVDGSGSINLSAHLGTSPFFALQTTTVQDSILYVELTSYIHLSNAILHII